MDYVGFLIIHVFYRVCPAAGRSLSVNSLIERLILVLRQDILKQNSPEIIRSPDLRLHIVFTRLLTGSRLMASHPFFSSPS